MIEIIWWSIIAFIAGACLQIVIHHLASLLSSGGEP